MGGAAPHPFFKEKPWGRGWVLTSPDIFKNRDLFPPFYFPSIRKRRFRVPKTWVLERSPEWSFCKRRFIVFVWTDVNEGFECDDVIHQTANALKGMLSYVHRFRAFMWPNKKESSKLHLNGYFSKKSEKKFSVFRNIRIRLVTQQSNHFCSIEARYAAWECTNFHEKKLPPPPSGSDA